MPASCQAYVTFAVDGSPAPSQAYAERDVAASTLTVPNSSGDVVAALNAATQPSATFEPFRVVVRK